MKFNISKEWLLKRAQTEEGMEIGAGGPVETLSGSLDWSRFPVREMYRRNWFEGFTGSLSAALTEAEELASEFVTRAIRRPVVALQRQRIRAGSEANPYALLAWQCRVLLQANTAAPRKTFKNAALGTSWLTALVQLSRFSDGPRRAIEYLRDAGVVVVIEPHLSSTHLDGAALLADDGPIIALTLRYDRLDNFWFVLLHELVHIKKHLKRGNVEDIFDDLESPADELERETDRLARDILIPSDKWQTALARYVRSEKSITSFAAEMSISPAIVAGRIRNEADNYIILSNLVGHGQVRKFFPNVRFG